jgi:FAT domain
VHFDPNWYKAWHNWALANLEAVNHLLNQGEAKAADVMGTTLVPHIIPASKLSIIISKQRLRRVYLKDNDGNGYHLEGYVQNVKYLSHFGPMET